mmetsp:Transcript_2544/g.7611  ORF Transcript_2544/g.7611 Transcript_2544/m.7611 type:complete len:274 (-) Transcript_2544:92-913(-)
MMAKSWVVTNAAAGLFLAVVLILTITGESPLNENFGDLQPGVSVGADGRNSVRYKEPEAKCRVGIAGGHVTENKGAWNICENWLDSDSIVYSFGIGYDASFDVDVAIKFNSMVFCMDPAITQRIFDKQVAKAKYKEGWSKDYLLTFVPIGLGGQDKEVKFDKVGGRTLPEDAEISSSVKGRVMPLEQVMSTLGHQYIDVLKIDVEGSEFDAFGPAGLMWLQTMHPQQILIEMHDRFFDDGKDKRAELVNALEAHGYSIKAQSAKGMELLLIKE